MLIKYHTPGEPVALTEVQDVDLDIETSTVVLTPIGDKFKDIEICNVTETEYEKIINDLYLYGKADLTSFSSRTRFAGDNQTESEEEDEEEGEAESFDYISSSYDRKHEEEKTDAEQGGGLFSGWFKKS